MGMSDEMVRGLILLGIVVVYGVALYLGSKWLDVGGDRWLMNFRRRRHRLDAVVYAGYKVRVFGAHPRLDFKDEYVYDTGRAARNAGRGFVECGAESTEVLYCWDELLSVFRREDGRIRETVHRRIETL